MSTIFYHPSCRGFPPFELFDLLEKLKMSEGIIAVITDIKMMDRRRKIESNAN